MAEVEELTDEQAHQGLTQLIVQYRAIAKIEGVFKRYLSLKQAVPELEKRKAHLDTQVATIQDSLPKLIEEYDRKVAEIRNDLAAKVERATDDYNQKERTLNNSIKVIEIRQQEREQGLVKARADAAHTLEEIKNTIKEAREKAAKEKAAILKDIEATQEQHAQVLAQFEALKQTITRR